MMPVITEQKRQELSSYLKGVRDGHAFCLPVERLREFARLRDEIALASLEAKPAAWWHRLVNKHNGVIHPWVYGSAEAEESEGDVFRIEVMRLYTAPPVPEDREPVVLPDMEEDESAFNAGVNALIDCLEDCGDAEQGLRLALRAIRAAGYPVEGEE